MLHQELLHHLVAIALFQCTLTDGTVGCPFQIVRQRSVRYAKARRDTANDALLEIREGSCWMRRIEWLKVNAVRQLVECAGFSIDDWDSVVVIVGWSVFTSV